MNSRIRELLKNTGLFAIGNLGSKILSFIIVPFYTYILSTSEYGRIDLLSTLVSFTLPITTLLIHEAAIRLLPSHEIDKYQASSNCFVVFIFGVAIIILVFPIVNLFIHFDDIAFVYETVLILYTFNDIFGNYLKALGKILLYSVYGLTNTIVFLAGNIILVLYLRIGIYGYFMSMLISQALSAVIVLIGSDLIHTVRFSNVSVKVLKKMLHYSIPMIPNTLMWWIMTGGDKYIINYFLGDSANGIYSLSLKIPTILSMFYAIFSSAWQLSSIKESNSKDRSEFYSKVYNYSIIVIAIGASFLIITVYPLFRYILSNNYFEGWKYVPYLLIATVISCLGTFLGTAYIISKQTAWSFLSTFFGAIVNIGLNFVLVKSFNLFGIVIGTIAGYMVTFIIRSYHAKKLIQMELYSSRVFILIALLLIQSGFSISWESIWCSFAQIVFVVLITLLYKKDIYEILMGFKRNGYK